MQPNINPKSLTEIQAALDQSYATIETLITAISDDVFHFKPGEKWSIGEHLEHLVLSTMGIASVLARPKAVFVHFGKPDKPSRSYEDLREKYFVLIQGRKAPANLSPDENAPKSKEELLQSWQLIRQKMNTRLPEHWIDAQLDEHCLLHPAFGKMNVREILFFTIFHNYHHYAPMTKIIDQKEV